MQTCSPYDYIQQSKEKKSVSERYFDMCNDEEGRRALRLKKKIDKRKYKMIFFGNIWSVSSLKGRPFRFIILKLCIYILLALKQNQITCMAN